MPARKSAPLLAPFRSDYTSNSRLAPLVTTHALLFHQQGAEQRGHRLALVTAHPVAVHGKDRLPVIGAGHAMTPSDERQILDLLTSRATTADFAVYPEHLLYHDASRSVWWVPPAVRPMYLRDARGTQTIRTRWPSLVMMTVDRKLFIAGVAGDSRPAGDTKLSHAPLPNMYASTQLCTGDAVLPPSSAIDTVPQWQAIVFETAWTHGNFQGGIRGRGGRSVKVDAFWRGRHEQETPFPGKHLVPLSQTLSDWIRYPTRGDNR